MPEQQPTEGTAAAPADAERQEHARRRTRMVAAGFYDAAKSERWLDSPELAQVNTDALFRRAALGTLAGYRVTFAGEAYRKAPCNGGAREPRGCRI